ncbi:DUF6187 family protein [Amycolatopsis sp. DG1A-15b]|jgi:hypothetical protein|uniref:DUF6187 family protein n=1 Tax=Amycolatopsis sp. DG1A-15b TaxID=3052846 RepID=UPI00255BF56C|nr:DUF6187 family protein [Amycolatopsis sp. DG1A-15b]WIX84515.1 DUF6187 family protein [Amycolatopsis sp. DG1A-15b]
MSDRGDLRFVLPDVEAPASVEAGVILLGLDADRLLAGLGLARLADDTALVTQVVDQARHGVGGFGFAALVASGAGYWRELRAFAGHGSPTGSPGALRREWEVAHALATTAVPGAGAATIAHLTACSLRRADVDPLADRYADGTEGT